MAKSQKAEMTVACGHGIPSEFTKETSLAKVHVTALQTSVAMPGGNLITPITRDVHI